MFQMHLLPMRGAKSACQFMMCHVHFATAALRKEEEKSAKMREKKRLEDEKKAKTAQAKVEAVCCNTWPMDICFKRSPFRMW